MKYTNRQIRLSSVVLLFSAASILQACTGDSGVTSLQVPTVSVQTFAHEVHFSESGALDPAEVKALDQFLEAISLRYGDRLSMDDPAKEGFARRHDAISSVIAKYGIELPKEPTPSGEPPAPGAIKLIVSRSNSVMPSCPNWSQNSTENYANATHSNFGCSINSNLAAMVADPHDLKSGKIYAGSDPASISKAINALNKRKPTGDEPLPSANTRSASKPSG